MARVLTPIPVRNDAQFISVGRASRLIVQPNSYRGVRQIQIATQSPRNGRKPEFADVADADLTAEMCNVRHGVNITHELWEVLSQMGDPAKLAIAAD